ncbi:MAG: hypothetical protein V1720_14090 [bacterium]
MLTGSMAMIYYAIPRMTRDIDIVIELSKFNMNNFIDEFTTDFYLSEHAINDAVNKEFLFNLIHLESSFKIDFIIRKNTQYRIEEFANRKKITINNFDLYIVSKEDLIISKLEWIRQYFSELQIKDVNNLLHTDCDRNYLNRWI